MSFSRPQFWHPDPARPSRRADRILARSLHPASLLYRFVHRLRWRLAAAARESIPVFCAGGLTVGGSGKTPLALLLADELKALGEQPHFLSRGFGRRLQGLVRADLTRHTAREIGDEPVLLARAAPVWLCADRARAARAAAAQGASALILDDGFQNPGLHKDCAILTLDPGRGLGNRRLFPAGPLREPLKDALARAQALLLIPGPAPDSIAAQAEKNNCPVFTGQITPRIDPANPLGKGRYLLFAGIAHPERFHSLARSLVQTAGGEIAAMRAFPDHHFYRPEEARQLLDQAARAGAKLLTTEKDMVRLQACPGAPFAQLRRICLCLPVRLQIGQPERFRALLRQTLETHRRPLPYRSP